MPPRRIFLQSVVPALWSLAVISGPIWRFLPAADGPFGIAGNAAGRRHIRLVKSEPASNDTTHVAPKAVRLWFSERVELKVTRVKLMDAAGSAVPLGKPTRADTERDAPVVSAIAKPLAPGGYTVRWSTSASDGHPARGTLEFVVKDAR